jgi:hypothetical protein
VSTAFALRAEALAEGLIDRRFAKAYADPFALVIAFAIVGMKP